MAQVKSRNDAPREDVTPDEDPMRAAAQRQRRFPAAGPTQAPRPSPPSRATRTSTTATASERRLAIQPRLQSRSAAHGPGNRSCVSDADSGPPERSADPQRPADETDGDGRA